MWRQINSFMSKYSINASYADDFMQEARILLYNRFDKYDSERASLPTFISNVTTNACYKYRTGIFKVSFAEESEVETWEDTTQDHSVLVDLVKTYSMDTRTTELVAKYILGYTQKDLAEHYNISQPMVSKIISKFKDIYLTKEKTYGTIREKGDDYEQH